MTTKTLIIDIANTNIIVVGDYDTLAVFAAIRTLREEGKMVSHDLQGDDLIVVKCRTMCAANQLQELVKN